MDIVVLGILVTIIIATIIMIKKNSNPKKDIQAPAEISGGPVPSGDRERPAKTNK